MKKILVIEDQQQSLNLFLKCLKAKGFSTIGAENGLTGIRLARQELPDLIVCDIMMPQLDGYEVLATLRQDPVTVTIPLIFVTAKVSRADMRKGMELGADDYLTKPCTLNELLNAIATRLERQTVLQQRFAAEAQLVPPPTNSTTASVSQSIFPNVPQLRAVFDFIEANYYLPITLSEVAQVVGYSPAYLTNLMHRQTGKTVQRWIIERRMAAARSLLLETDCIVEQIASQVGYHNVVHFFRQFRQIHGITPQAWRKQNRSQVCTNKSVNNC